MRNSNICRVAIISPTSVPWMARCLDGIRRYAREQGGWHLFSSPPTLRGAEESALTLLSMRGWKGDAIIAASSDQEELDEAKKMGIPIVNLAGGLRESHGIPRVMVNNYQAGRIAADHLLGRGLKHLAFFGWKNRWYSDQRCLGFSERATEVGVPCHIFLLEVQEKVPLDWNQRIAGVSKWLASLPGPCGVFAAHDYRAQLLIEACQELHLRIPEDISLMGMDNDETVCEHTMPTLTSISRNSEKTGWNAAALLHRMMQGEKPPEEDFLIEPRGVIERQSTDMLFYMDPVVKNAVEYVRKNLAKNFNIAAIAEAVGVSKRTLEMRFRDGVGRSPHEYISQLRVQRAQALLQMPQKRTINQISLECGFGTIPTFYTAFQRITGETPASFRKKYTAG